MQITSILLRLVAVGGVYDMIQKLLYYTSLSFNHIPSGALFFVIFSHFISYKHVEAFILAGS